MDDAKMEVQQRDNRGGGCSTVGKEWRALVHMSMI